MAVIKIQEELSKLKLTMLSDTGIVGVSAHASTHEDGGSDELTAQNLGSGAALVGKLLQSDGAGGWTLIDIGAGVGDVVGPASSTDEALARYNSTTGKLLKNSAATLTDAGAMAGIATVNGVVVEGHAARHEDAGADEIDVTDLSGLLADPQTPAAHAAAHEDGGGDEIDVTDLSGVLADPQVPVAHAAAHEDGGGDEIDVTDLSGVLADPQTPATHAADHSDGGGDEVDAGDLGSGGAGSGEILAADGTGGASWVAPPGGVLVFATEVALLADTSADGAIAYAQDTDRFFFRKNGAWVARGQFVATDTVSALGAGAGSERFGAGAAAGGSSSVAVGASANAANVDSVAIGASATASGAQGTAVGKSANAGIDTVSVGQIAFCTAQRGVCIGAGSYVSTNDSTAVGYDAETTATNTVCIGKGSRVGGTSSIAMGVSASAPNADSVAIGASSTASGLRGTAIGKSSTAGIDSFAAGQLAFASAQRCVSVGAGSIASSNDSVAVGYDAEATATNAVCVGEGTRAGATNTVAIGRDAAVNAVESVAIGASAVCGGADCVTIGYSASAAVDAVAVGKSASAGHSSGVAIGMGAATSGIQSACVGAGSVANEYAVALGDDAEATHSRSGAIGQASRSTTANRITFGQVDGVTNNRRDVEVSGDLHMSLNSTRGDAMQVKASRVLASSLSGASVNVAAIPAGSLVLGVSIRVDVAVTGATGIDVGISGATQRYGANIPVALNSTSDLTDFVNDTPPSIFPAATNVVLTGVGGSFTGGNVTVFVHYMTLKAPTS